MINKFKVAFVTRQAVGRTAIQDVLKHLIRFGPNHPHGAIANLNRRPRLRRLRAEWKKLRKGCSVSGGDRLHQLYRTLIRRTTHITGANVMIIGEDAGQVAVDLNSLGPVFLSPRANLILLGRQIGIGTGRRWWRLAEVIVHLAAIAERIQRGDHGLAIRAFPNADIEWNADGCFFRRIRSTDMRRRLPTGR